MWHFEPENDYLAWSSPPAAAYGLVYYSVAEVGRSQDTLEDILNSNLYAIDAKTGKEKWLFTETISDAEYGVPPMPPIVDRNIIYFVSWGNENLYALSTQTGEVNWHFKANSLISYPVIADEVISFVSSDSYIYSIDAKTGQEIWRAKQ